MITPPCIFRDLSSNLSKNLRRRDYIRFGYLRYVTLTFFARITFTLHVYVIYYVIVLFVSVACMNENPYVAMETLQNSIQSLVILLQYNNQSLFSTQLRLGQLMFN